MMARSISSPPSRSVTGQVDRGLAAGSEGHEPVASWVTDRRIAELRARRLDQHRASFKTVRISTGKSA
jgi:hypothetical protein